MPRFIQKRDTNSIFYIIALVIFVAFAGFTVSGEGGLIRLLQLHKTKNGLLHENRGLLLENLALRQELKSMRHPRALEAEAHKSLGLAYPDEIVWVDPSVD